MQSSNEPQGVQRNRQMDPPPGSAPRRSNPKPSRFPEQGKNWFTVKKRVRITHVILFVVVAMVLAVILMANNAQLNKMRSELEDTRAVLLQTQEELASKERALRFAETDAYVEQEARKRFDYIREGEMRFVPSTTETNPYGY